MFVIFVDLNFSIVIIHKNVVLIHSVIQFSCIKFRYVYVLKFFRKTLSLLSWIPLHFYDIYSLISYYFLN